MANTTTLRSVFAVWNNPRVNYTYKHDERTGAIVYEDGKPVVIDEEPTIFAKMSDEEICKTLVEMWCATKPGRTGACTYCVSATGLHHLHFILECSRDDKFKYATIQKLYNQKMHLEMTRGNKQQAENYINKWGNYEEKGEIVLAKYQSGEIQGAQGQRRDINEYGKLIEQGKTPQEIMREDFGARRYEKMLKDAFFDYRDQNTPFMRDVNVIWHFGETGTGKSYEVEKYSCEHPGEVYCYNNYQKGGLDLYNGEPVLHMEEFRGQIQYNILLNMLDKYKRQFDARYTPTKGLWTTVHITSPYSPIDIYDKMVHDKNDTLEQLLRRINVVKYHYKRDGSRWGFLLENPLDNKTTLEMIKKAAELDYNENRFRTICTDDSDYEKLKRAPIELIS